MLNRKSFFIREHVGFLKMSDTYDILDPLNQEKIGVAKEKPGGLVIVLRFLINRQILPTKVLVYEGDDHENEGKLLFSIKRGFTFFRSKVNICNKEDVVVGWLKQKAFSLGGAFYVFNASGQEIAFVKGDWKGWNFKFLDSLGQEFGTITKKWAGIGKELFTSADNYIIDLNKEPTSEKAILLLAAGLAVDIVYKEK